MNAARKQRLAEAMDILNEVRAEEEEAMNNLPDSFREGQQGERMQGAIDFLENAISEIEEITNS